MLVSLALTALTGALSLSLRLPSSRCRQRSRPVTLQLDPQRVDAIRRLFYVGTPASDDEVAAQPGLIPDLPIARWSMIFLPHQQTMLNVHRPQYTLMFETLLSTEPPWLYLHAQLPEPSIENLGNEEYALPQEYGGAHGPKASLIGTLMHVVDVERCKDGRLELLAQGIGRAAVLRETQSVPYARADVQWLPDAETLLSCEARRIDWNRSQFLGEAALDLLGLSARKRLQMALALAEERSWRAYEHETTYPIQLAISSGMYPAFCPFDTSAAELAVRGAPLALSAALEAAAALDGMQEGEPSSSHAELGGGAAFTTSHARSAAVRRAFEACEAMLEVSDDAMQAEAESERALQDLELQVWLELDGFLRRFAANRATLIGGTGAPAPKQLLGLLPPPPESGWPDDFMLDTVAADLRKAATRRRSQTMLSYQNDPAPFIPAHRHYPLRRRAQRLSYSIWIVLKEPGLDLQPLLDTESTTDRLRMVLLRLRELLAREESGS